jgi:drug/metabolite transporter (DMT)-like permease
MKSIRSLLVLAIPPLFVFLWSTGFVSARYVMPYASPFAFLSIRFVLTIVLVGSYCLVVRSVWPKGRDFWAAFVIGILIHAAYLGGVFFAVKHGFPSGFAGLIVGLQPIMTAVLAGAMIGERVSLKQWIGLAVGLLGVGLVLGPRVAGVGIGSLGYALIVMGGVAAFSLGTVLQKRFGSSKDLAAGTVVQYLGAFAVSVPIVFLFESWEITWNLEIVVGLLWLVLVLSVGAIFLLLVMIRAGEVARVASLFYLVPAVSALLAYILFGEQLNWIQMLGIAITSAGVALATLGFRSAPAAVQS